MVWYSWFYIPDFIFLVLPPGRIALLRRCPGILMVWYSWFYIPGFIFLMLYSWFCHLERIALLRRCPGIFMVRYSWFYIPGFIFLILYSWFCHLERIALLRRCPGIFMVWYSWFCHRSYSIKGLELYAAELTPAPPQFYISAFRIENLNADLRL